MLDFYVEFFGDRFSATFSVLTAEKARMEHSRNNSAKKIGEKNSFFASFFRCVFFGISLATPYFEQFLPSNRKISHRIRSARNFPQRMMHLMIHAERLLPFQWHNGCVSTRVCEYLLKAGQSSFLRTAHVVRHVSSDAALSVSETRPGKGVSQSLIVSKGLGTPT